MASIPYTRVETLIYGKGNQPTPRTLTGDSETVISYAKVIGRKVDGIWNVVSRESSQTTNRHIDALMFVLMQNNETVVRVDYHTGDVLPPEAQ